MLCPKCGAELASEQKVCVICGALTPASGYYYSDKRQFVFTKQLKIASIVVAVFFIALVLYLILRITPPDVIAREWLKSMCNRNINHAASLVTEQYKSSLAEQFSDMREVSDNLYTDYVNNNATIAVGEPDYRESALEEKALVSAALITPDGQAIRQMQFELLKEGRRWRVNRFN